MSTFIQKVLSIAVVSLAASAPTLSHAERLAKVVPDFTVFVDPPTGFVFLKLPSGWKFVGQLEAGQAARLPSGVVTVLLDDEDQADVPKSMATIDDH